jgi:hypothetical protein
MMSTKFGTSGGMLAIFLLFGLAICPALRANTLDSSVIGMFPKDVSELRYVDLSGARQFAWFPQFQEQLVPDCIPGFERFLQEAQVQQPPSIDQVAWARVSISGNAQLVAIGVGQFDLETIKSFLDSWGASSIKIGPYEVYASLTNLGMSDGYFSLVDSTTVAFGPLEGLRRVLEIRAGKEANVSANAGMMSLIRQVNDDTFFWSALVSAKAEKAIQHLTPELMKFPQAKDVVGKLKGLLISMKVSDDIQLDFKVDSASPGDAVVLSQLLDASLLSKRFQSGESNPDLIKVLDGMVVTPSGNQLDIWLPVTDDQMQSLADRNTFDLLM